MYVFLAKVPKLRRSYVTVAMIHCTIYHLVHRNDAFHPVSVDERNATSVGRLTELSRVVKYLPPRELSKLVLFALFRSKAKVAFATAEH